MAHRSDPENDADRNRDERPNEQGEVEFVTIADTIAGWRRSNGKPFSDRTLRRAIDDGKFEKHKVNDRVMIPTDYLDATFERHHGVPTEELNPTEVTDTLAQALFVGTGLFDLVSSTLEQVRLAEQATHATRIDLLSARLSEAEVARLKLQTENESLGAELKAAQLLGISQDATIARLATEVDLRDRFDTEREAQSDRQAEADAAIAAQLSDLTAEITTVRSMLTSRRRRWFRQT